MVSQNSRIHRYHTTHPSLHQILSGPPNFLSTHITLFHAIPTCSSPILDSLLTSITQSTSPLSRCRIRVGVEEEARRTLEALMREFEERKGMAEGLVLWRYEVGEQFERVWIWREVRDGICVRVGSGQLDSS
jgi:hypothetical protein